MQCYSPIYVIISFSRYPSWIEFNLVTVTFRCHQSVLDVGNSMEEKQMKHGLHRMNKYILFPWDGCLTLAGYTQYCTVDPRLPAIGSPYMMQYMQLACHYYNLHHSNLRLSASKNHPNDNYGMVPYTWISNIQILIISYYFHCKRPCWLSESNNYWLQKHCHISLIMSKEKKIFAFEMGFKKYLTFELWFCNKPEGVRCAGIPVPAHWVQRVKYT